VELATDEVLKADRNFATYCVLEVIFCG